MLLYKLFSIVVRRELDWDHRRREAHSVHNNFRLAGFSINDLLDEIVPYFDLRVKFINYDLIDSSSVVTKKWNRIC